MRVIRKLLARWLAFNAIARVLTRREVAREAFMPLSREALLIDSAETELTFDEMVGIVYRNRSLAEAVVLQMANLAAFWRCRSELAVSEHGRDEARNFESIILEAATDLAAEKLPDRAAAWVHGLVDARVREERTHHPDYVPPAWQRSGDGMAA
ncbi:MAG TPA: hypothetical protein PKE27_15180 [Povalibacter sp.]|uniref:hypothetical protein n=1 Tax=Povalibacter sp. TaxID=1962978 RepID=UPI002C1997C6|nr:hypothetical protein [Povalibacter sp.]HMN45920.1 hypothetical protein [Povalibacter sp.]